MRGQGSIFLRGKIWWIQWSSQGIRLRESSGTSDKTAAVALLNARLADAALLPPAREVTVGRLLNDLLTDYERNRRSEFAKRASSVHLRPYWSRFLAHQVTTAKARAYQDRRLAQGAAPATVNREMALLRRSLNLGFRSGLVRSVPFIPRLRENNVRTGFLEMDQYQRLLDELPPYLKALLVIGYHVGNRKGELLKLQVPQIDLRLRQIRLAPGTTKNGRGRVLPIYGDMIPFLTRHLAELQRDYPGCPWVFHRDGKRIKYFQVAWGSATARAGLSWLLFHDLRRSAVRNMERAGVPRSVAMEISGHRTEATYRRYDIVSSRDVSDAGSKLANYLSKAKSRQPAAVTPIDRKKKAG